jgi:hypothetical protein
MSKAILILPFVLVAFVQQSHGQPFVGIWEVVEVRVGDEIMTPVAKWFRFIPRGVRSRVEGGNGGIQNMAGLYAYGEENKMLYIMNEDGEEDEFGPFQTEMRTDGLKWQREEEGQLVTVTLHPAMDLPLAPWDKAIGQWNLEGDNATSIFMRWDRIFIKRDEGARESGIWQIHAHRPALRLLSDAGDDHDENWQITFEGNDQMLWTREKDGKTETKVWLKPNP